MANFDDQIMGMTGLTISGSSTLPSQAELSTFLNDGVFDVTNRTLAIRPQDAYKFQRASSEITSNDSASSDINGAKIISVVRESNVNNQWEQCRKISTADQYVVTDKSSLSYASIFNPAYAIMDNGLINVYPVPGANPNAFKVYYVNNAPEEGDGTDLIHSSSTIKYFPSEKIYLVVIYAAIKSLECKMADYTIEEEDIELVQAITQNLTSLKQQYESAFVTMTAKQGGGR